MRTSAVECQTMLSINTLDQYLNYHSIDIPIDKRLTLKKHLINNRLIVSQVSTNSYASIKN